MSASPHVGHLPPSSHFFSLHRNQNISMGEKKAKHNNTDASTKPEPKKQKTSSTTSDPNNPSAFKPTSQVKGLKFGAQFITKSFTIRRVSPLQLIQLLTLNPTSILPSTISYMPTNFTILAHHALHTLTLGLGTKKSKVVIFIFESDSLKHATEKLWPNEISLGQVNKKLIRGLSDCEMARFKFRKGAITFYVYAVRRIGCIGFSRSEDLRRVLEKVVELKDFLDHTAMLALPDQRSISFSNL